MLRTIPYSAGGWTVLDHAFASGVEFVVALTLAENVASQRVCRRLAMQDLGMTDRYYGGASLRLFRVQSDKLSRL